MMCENKHSNLYKIFLEKLDLKIGPTQTNWLLESHLKYTRLVKNFFNCLVTDFFAAPHLRRHKASL